MTPYKLTDETISIHSNAIKLYRIELTTEIQ